MSTLANQPIDAARGMETAVIQGGHAPAVADEALGFSDVVRILKQRKLAILITSVIAYVLVCVGTLLIYKFMPLWESEALFELTPPIKAGSLVSEPVEVDTNTMERLLQTEAGKMKGLSLLLDVAKEEEVKRTAYYDWYEND